MAEQTLRDVYALIREAFKKGKKKKGRKHKPGDIELSEEGLLRAERKRVKIRKKYEKELGY